LDQLDNLPYKSIFDLISTISILCILILIVSIGAPPVHENEKPKAKTDDKEDASDEVVCRRD